MSAELSSTCLCLHLHREIVAEYEKIYKLPEEPLTISNMTSILTMLSLISLDPKYAPLWSSEVLTKDQVKELFRYADEEKPLYNLYKISFKYFIMTRFVLLLWLDDDIPVLQKYTTEEQMALTAKRFRKDRANRILQSSPVYLDYVFSLDPIYLVDYCIKILNDNESNFEYCVSAFESGNIMWFELDDEEWEHNLNIIKAYTYKL